MATTMTPMQPSPTANGRRGLPGWLVPPPPVWTPPTGAGAGAGRVSCTPRTSVGTTTAFSATTGCTVGVITGCVVVVVDVEVVLVDDVEVELVDDEVVVSWQPVSGPIVKVLSPVVGWR